MKYIDDSEQDKSTESEVSEVNKYVSGEDKLVELLLTKGLVSKDQINIAQRERLKDSKKGTFLGSILVEFGFLTEIALSEVLSESSGTENLDLKTTFLDSKIIKMIPKDLAVKYKIVAISYDEVNLVIAMSDIYNIIAIDNVRKLFPKNVKISTIYAQENQILEIIDQYYEYEMSIDGILKEIESSLNEKGKLSTEGYSNPTVRLVDAIIVDGVKIGASDLHFEPEASFVRIRYRIDGKLRQIRSFHKEYWPAIVVRIKILAGMNIAESRYPQDGRMNYHVLGREVDFRIATHPTVHGENIVMRILDKKNSLMPLEGLGFCSEHVNLLKKLLKRPEGIIIVTGPTGSGKTTTLYSVLNYINNVEKNIMTLEDPVEYQLTMIRQSGVKEGTGISFVEGVRSLMRQDPDVIFIGEIRDEPTASMAIRASMTGHQVYSTLHSNDAIGALTRFNDIGIKNTLLSGNMVCILAQRLARRLCKHCKVEKRPNEEEYGILGLKNSDNVKIYEKFGCEQCAYTGYKGRMIIGEVLAVDKGLDELIATNATRRSMLEHATSHGFKQMIEDGVEKVLNGHLDIEELMTVVDVTERIK
jgi:type IV pilus assembly protein PilB